MIALAITLLLLLRQHRDRSDPLVRAWRRVVRRLARAGLRKHESEPPLSFVERVALERPALAERLLTLGRRYSDCRYAGHGLDADERLQLIKDLRDFRA